MKTARNLPAKNHPFGAFLALSAATAAALAAITLSALSPRTASATDSTTTTGSQKMAIPAYFYPNPNYPEWPQLTNGHAVAIAIMNPSSGPGSRQNSDYVKAVNNAKDAGKKVFGYVYTSYGARSWGGARGVKADIDKYYSWYGVDGIFLDEAEYRDCSDENYYLKIFDYVRNKDSTNYVLPSGELTARKNFVVQNPGTQTQECYMKSADIVVNFESTYDTYKNSYSAPTTWDLTKYPATRFWHLVHTAKTESEMKDAVHLSKGRNAGYMYVTPDVMSNPWDTLPKDLYWSEELTALSSP